MNVVRGKRGFAELPVYKKSANSSCFQDRVSFSLDITGRHTCKHCFAAASQIFYLVFKATTSNMLPLVIIFGLFALTNAQIITTTECGTGKACLKDPPSCSSSSNCNYLITWKRKASDNNVLEFEVSSKISSGWVALGFNDAGPQMVSTKGEICYFNGVQKMLQGFHATSKSRPAWQSPPSNTVLRSLEVNNGAIICRFSRPLIGSSYQNSVTSSIYPIMAAGTVSNGVVDYHSGKKVFDRVNFSTFTNMMATTASSSYSTASTANGVTTTTTATTTTKFTTSPVNREATTVSSYSMTSASNSAAATTSISVGASVYSNMMMSLSRSSIQSTQSIAAPPMSMPYTATMPTTSTQTTSPPSMMLYHHSNSIGITEYQVMWYVSNATSIRTAKIPASSTSMFYKTPIPNNDTKTARGMLIDLTACGKAKECFKIPSDCSSSSSCRFIVTWQSDQKSKQVKFEVKGNRNGWVAFGLNEAARAMPGTYGEICYMAGSTPMVKAFHASGKKLPMISAAQPNGITVHNTVQSGGIICRYTRTWNQTDASYSKGINKDAYIIVASGDGVNGGNPSYHNNNRGTSSKKYNVAKAMGTNNAANKETSSLIAFAFVGTFHLLVLALIM